MGCSLLLTGCQIPGKESKSALQVVTGDTPASLFLDGQYIEKTPYVNKNVQSGKKVLRIDPDDDTLLAHEMNINLQPGLMTVITWLPGSRPELNEGVVYELEKIEGSASELKVTTIPDNAIVTLTNQEQTFAPTTFHLKPGEYEYEVSLPAFRTQKHSVKLNPGYRTVASLTLARADSAPLGTIPLASPSSAITPLAGNRFASISAQVSSDSATTSAQSTTTVTGSRIRILPTNYHQNSVEGLRVRSEPSATGSILGFAPSGSSYPYTGRSEKGWYQIEWASNNGWVTGQFAQLYRE